MGASAFRKGAFLEIDETPYTILRKVTDELWQLENTRTGRISERTDSELRALYSDGHLIFITESRASRLLSGKARMVGKPFREISKEELKIAKERRAYVHAVLDIPNHKTAMAPAIEVCWRKLKGTGRAPGYATVYRWKCRYVAAGRDITALVPLFDKRGSRISRYPTEVIELVGQAIETHFLTRERKTIQDTLDHAISSVDTENKLRPRGMRLPRPTRRMVTRLIQAIPAYDRYAARHGKLAADKKFRSVLKHRITDAPLERAEIDHTHLDVMVIDDDTNLPLGRPWLTACLDDNTRNFLGAYISFEPPSYLTVARCLKQALLPKTNLTREYPDLEHTWDAHGVMRALVVDNGLEFHSDSLEAACLSLGTEIHYSARKTPWYKAKIERAIGSLNAGVAHGVPGTTFSNIFDKDDYDPAEHAVIRLSTLRRIVVTWIVDYYHQKPHRTLQAPPAVVWRRSIKPEDILVPDDPARLDAILGRRAQRMLTHKGIELDGLLYNSPELTELRMRHGDKLDVEVSIDDSDIGSVTVLSPDKTRMFKVPALASTYARGVTRWQHRVFKRFAALEMRTYDPSSWLEAKERISALVEQAFKEFKRRKTRSRLARFKGDSKPLAPSSDLVVDAPAPQGTAQPKSTDRPAPQAVPSAAPRTPPLKSASSPKRFTPVLRDRDVQRILADQKGD